MYIKRIGVLIILAINIVLIKWENRIYVDFLILNIVWAILTAKNIIYMYVEFKQLPCYAYWMKLNIYAIRIN